MSTTNGNLNPQYTIGMNAIRRCRDVYQGQSAITRMASSDGTGATIITPYFPMFVPADQARYNRVISLSSFTNYTGHTVDKLVGATFSEPPKTNIESNPNTSYLLDDADGAGGDLAQVANNLVLNNTIAGRHVLLANYPSTAGQVLSKEDTDKLGLKASIQQYPAETLVDWKEENGKLKYITLLEQKLDNPDDMFSHDFTVGQRVYYMHEDKCYQQFLDNNDAVFVAENGEPILDYNGRPFDEIPAVIVGSVSNTSNIDKPPISDMCDVNIAHYQISVLETENLAIHGQVTLGVTADLSVDDWQKANPSGVKIGANSGYFLGSNGGFHTATAPESSSLPAAKEVKKQELVALGANLIDKNETVKTATEAGIQASEQTSIMINVVNNSSDGIERCINWIERMMTANPRLDAEYRISTEFFDNTISPELFNSALAAQDREVISDSAMQQILTLAFPMVNFEEESVILASEGG